MAVSHGVSAILSLTISLLLIAGMQIFKLTLASSQVLTIFAGFIASLVFMFLLTAISNFEMNSFGKHFQSKLLEVVISLFVSCFVASLVHRVSITTCVIFSGVALHYMSKIGARENQTSSGVPVASVPSKKKR